MPESIITKRVKVATGCFADRYWGATRRAWLSNRSHATRYASAAAAAREAARLNARVIDAEESR